MTRQEKTKQSKRTKEHKTRQNKTRQGKTLPVLRFFGEGFALIYSRGEGGGRSRRSERVRVRAKQGKIRQIKPR